MMDWKAIPWRKLERNVFKLQTRIFKASHRDDRRTVRQPPGGPVQKTLMRSWSAQCLAVRRVTQDNQGKHTAGVDGVKSLPPKQRLDLVNQLTPVHKPKPTRRVWISKPGSTEKRPLGIPTLHDRAQQALVKQVLEPEWEAKFEPNSYGFRPGRSAHDAIAAIFSSICHKPKYVLDADIAKCFDCIDHQALSTKLATFPSLRRQISGWLKAGVMDGDTLYPTLEGTPQGGVISPLLANIALHGMEQWLKQEVRPKRRIGNDKRGTGNPVHFIRYADDFVLVHEDLETVQLCRERIATWLMSMGLALKPSKTRVTHTLQAYEGSIGFDFLGFTIRQFSKQTDQGTGKLRFTTLIKPAQESAKRHYKRIDQLIDRHKSNSQVALINELNPVIRGWSTYYSRVVSKEHFTKLDHLIVRKLKTWAKRRHPTKSTHWIYAKYWQMEKGKKWLFRIRLKGSVIRLLHHSETPIIRHIKVQRNRSPYDGDWIYWSTRLGRSPQVSNRFSLLLKMQKGKCRHCNLFFRDEDVLEVDHIVPRLQGGKDVITNLQLLHRHCHDRKTAADRPELSGKV
ncbi:group II intron reverse transcriptase/maturase [Spirosoma agri]|nr:group II intron reverse transcriptase/maturase [Spirosoma agri]